MTDTTDKALDALQERLKAHDDHPESASAQADAAIAALRVERDAAIAREKALLASNQEERTALVEAAVSLRRERDALRAQLAKAHSERDAAIAAMSEAARKLGEAEGKLAASEMVGVVEGWRDRALKAEASLATARADALREAHERLWDKLGGQCRLEACDIVEALIYTPFAPSPEAVARAALEWAAGELDGCNLGLDPADMADDMRTAATDPATLAAIIAKAGGGE